MSEDTKGPEIAGWIAKEEDAAEADGFDEARRLRLALEGMRMHCAVEMRRHRERLESEHGTLGLNEALANDPKAVAASILKQALDGVIGFVWPGADVDAAIHRDGIEAFIDATTGAASFLKPEVVIAVHGKRDGMADMSAADMATLALRLRALLCGVLGVRGIAGAKVEETKG